MEDSCPGAKGQPGLDLLPYDKPAVYDYKTCVEVDSQVSYEP